MLILGRKVGESLLFDDAGITVDEVAADKVGIAFWGRHLSTNGKESATDLTLRKCQVGDERLYRINEHVTIQIIKVSENNANIGINAADHIRILRAELAEPSQMEHMPYMYRPDLVGE